MPKFDPWSVFFKREWNRNWPFLVGFAVTGAIITKMSLGLTGIPSSSSLFIHLFIKSSNTIPIISFLEPFAEEDAKNSPFVQRHKR
ncbi:hypothetical protein HHK36_019039 [Tetracentron sinense]|uniref:Uncharacterized protein n=1 Tax=Tetracentron sinense TaxID=13715 RepID=A0A835D980_TETSI|nr:hypothetical protein HHK36_019039 [Tetracentron sinense]